MVDFPKYESYKDSGVEWLGEIPSHWDTKKLKFMAKQISEKVDMKKQTGNYLGLENIESWTGKIIESELIVEGIANRFQPQDVLFGKLRPYLAKVYLAEQEGLCTTEALVLRVSNQNSRYFFYLLLSQGFIELVNSSVYGSKMPRASWEFIGCQFLPLPTLEEQKRIVEFLARKTAEIDQAIAQKQRLIELLQEQKAILINQAVTKGLDPNVPMCDRGVEWIGEIPEHWITSRIGFLGTVTKLTGFEYTNHWKVDEKGEIIALRGFNIGARKLNLENTENINRCLANKLERSKLSKGNLVAPCTGTLGNAAVIQENDRYHINQNIAKIHINKNILPDFLCYWMTSDLFKKKIEKNNVSGMQPVLLIGSIRKLEVVVPPVKEQEEIVKKLNQVDEEFDLLISKEKAIIELLEIFRKSCIANAVTGKIKV